MTAGDRDGRRRRAGLLVAGCLTLTVLATGCSGGDLPSSDPSSIPSSAPSSAASSVPAAPTPSETAPGGGPTGSSAAPEPSAPPTTPQPGSVEETVAPGSEATAKPVKLENTRARFDDSLSVTISGLRSASVKSQLPGEVAGPSVIFEVTIKNGGDKVVDLNQLVVNVLDDEQVPGSRITTKPARPMPHAVDGGSVARGRFVYVVPKKKRDPITVQVSLTAEQPVLVFKGRV